MSFPSFNSEDDRIDGRLHRRKSYADFLNYVLSIYFLIPLNRLVFLKKDRGQFLDRTRLCLHFVIEKQTNQFWSFNWSVSVSLIVSTYLVLRLWWTYTFMKVFSLIRAFITSSLLVMKVLLKKNSIYSSDYHFCKVDTFFCLDSIFQKVRIQHFKSSHGRSFLSLQTFCAPFLPWEIRKVCPHKRPTWGFFYLSPFYA